jgi:tyrosine-protein phosphatase SIW14
MTRLLKAAFSIAPLFLVAAAPPGIQKFEQLNPHVYRGGQPTQAGFQALAKMGVRTVLDLRDRAAQTRRERQMVESLGMRFVTIPMSMGEPTDGEMAHIIDQLNASDAWPLFVHCQGGRDRTSAVIACYRIQHDGWTNQQAYNEALRHGISSLDIGLRRYILRYKNPSAPANPPSSLCGSPGPGKNGDRERRDKPACCRG